MEKLIELRTFCVKEKEYATFRTGKYSITPMSKRDLKLHYKGEEKAYSSIIEQLDLILNNSVVKPSERRSPTDESFDGVSRPTERQNPQEEILNCTCIYRTEKSKRILVDCCENCTKEFLKTLKA